MGEFQPAATCGHLLWASITFQTFQYKYSSMGFMFFNIITPAKHNLSVIIAIHGLLVSAKTHALLNAELRLENNISD